MQHVAAVLFQKSEDEHPRERFKPIEFGKILLKIVSSFLSNQLILYDDIWSTFTPRQENLYFQIYTGHGSFASVKISYHCSYIFSKPNASKKFIKVILEGYHVIIKARVDVIAVLGFSVILIVMSSFFRARHYNTDIAVQSC